MFVRDRLLRSEADRASLLDLYGQVRGGKRVRDDDTNPLVSLLGLSGITRVVAACLRVRNRIYERVFDREWVTTHMPEAEMQRQRAAFRRGLLRAALVAGVIVAVITALAGLAASNATRAQRAARHTQELLARAQLDRGVRRLEAGDRLGMLDLLQAHHTAAGLPELQRGVASVWAGWAAASDHRLISLMGHSDGVNAIAISPDGRRLASGSSDHTARLWDLGAPPRTIGPGQPHGLPLQHADRVWAVAFSPNGKLLATASADRTARLWETASCQPHGPPLRHQGVVRSLAISPDGKLLATGSEDKTARLWEVATGHPHGLPLRHQGSVTAVAFSPDGKLLATVSWDGWVHLWRTATGQRQCPPMHDAVPSQLVFSPDGKLLAAGGGETEAKLWDTTTGRQQARGMRHEGRVTGVAFSPDGRLLASLGWDGTARLWRMPDGRPASPPLQHHGAVLAAAFSPDSRLLATASADATARLWDTATGQPYGPPLRHQGTLRQVLFTPNGRWLATASRDGTVRLWATQVGSDAGHPHSLALRHPHQVFGVAFSPDGRLLATGGRCPAQLWDATTGRPHGRPLGHWGPWAVAFSPNGRLLAAAYSEHMARLWEVATGQLHGRRLEHRNWVTDLAFSPDGKLLATGGLFDRVSLWDATTGRLRGQSGKHPDNILAVAFSPDGKRLASSTPADGTVWLWDPTTGEARGQLSLQPDPIQALAFSPDGKWLATGSDNGTARVWDAITGRPQSPPLGYQKTIKSVAFSPDGRLLATGSLDHTARVWELATSQPYGPPLLHTGRVSRVAFSPVGYPRSGRGLLATAAWDATVRLWCLPELPSGAREMALRTWVELGAWLDPQGNPVAIPWQQWRAFRAELEAIDDQRARTWARDPWWDWSGQGESHARRGEWKDAIVCYSRAIRLGASDWRVGWQRGEAYAALGQQRQAAADFAAAFRHGADWLHIAPSSGQVVQLRWRAVPYAAGYHVYRGSGVQAPQEWLRLTPGPLTQTVFTDRGLGLVSGGLQVYGVAPLFKSGSGQTVEAPLVPVQVGLAVPGFCGSTIEEGDRPGSARFDRASGEISLRGSGVEIGGTADGGYFLSQTVSGDFRITVQATTRPTATDDAAKAGLMIRESLDPGARSAFLTVTARNGLDFLWRSNISGGSDRQEVLSDAALKLPISLRLTRRGDTITPEYSVDGGQRFQPAGAVLKFPQPLPQTLSAGLAITSRYPSQTSEAKFRGLRIYKQ